MLVTNINSLISLEDFILILNCDVYIIVIN